MSIPVNWSVIEAASATSSSDLAKAVIDAAKDAKNMAEGQVILCDEQTSGRGRSGRQWVSKPGDGLYMSAIICPTRDKRDWPSLSFVASLSVYAAIEGLYPKLSPELKWPNDLLLDGRKLGGILLDSYGDHVIIGYGLNLKNAPILEGSDWQTTDLSAHGATDFSPRQVADTILARLAEYYQIWCSAGPAPLLARWQDKAAVVGRAMTVRVSDATVSGCCEALGPDGSLVLRDKRKKLHHITAGDVLLMGELDVASH